MPPTVATFQLVHVWRSNRMIINTEHISQTGVPIVTPLEKHIRVEWVEQIFKETDFKPYEFQ